MCVWALPLAHAITATAQSPPAGESAVRLDLSVALRHELILERLDDEGQPVAVGDGREIVLLPFPVAPLNHAKPQTLGQGTLRADAEPGRKEKFLGFRILNHKNDQTVDTGDSGAPLFEQIVVSSSHGAARIVAVNAKRPLVRSLRGGRAAKVKAPKSGRQALEANDWVAAVFEIDVGARILTLTLGKDPPERIDLSYLSGLHGRSGRNETQPDEKAVSETLRVLGEPHGAMAALAALRIGQWRGTSSSRIASDATSRWTRALVAALSHADARPRRAAWEALLDGPPLSAADALAATSAGSNANEFIVSNGAAALTNAQSNRRINVLALLHAAWKKADARFAARLLAVLLADGGRDAIAALDEATPAGFDLMLKAAQTESRADVRMGLVRVMVGQAPLEREAALLAEARRLKIQIVDPADPMLKRFVDSDDPRGKQTVLRALDVVPATAILHTRAFRDFVDAATGPRQDAAVREAAFHMVLSQAAMASGPGGPAFPLPAGAGGLDALSSGLIRAIAGGAPDSRAGALVAMVQRGESRAAAETLARLKLAPESLAALLGKTLSRPELARADGTFALLAALATRTERKSAGVVLRQLDALGNAYPEASRWRMAAALKAGTDWNGWISLSVDRDAAVASSATRWLATAARLRASESEKLSAGKRNKDREAVLLEVQSRRAARRDGRYACLLVVETMAPLDDALFGRGDAQRWDAPRRATLFGPIVTLQQHADRCVISADGARVGEGRAPAGLTKLIDPRFWPPLLTPTTWSVFGVGQEARGGATKFSPLALPGAALLAEGAAAALNVDAVPLVRAGLKVRIDASTDSLHDALPERLVLTLRDFGLGVLAGTAPSVPPPDSSRGAALLNVLVILEPLD